MRELLKNWKNMTEDDRPFKWRLLISSIIGFVFSFSLIIFGFFDFFISNRNSFPVVFTDFCFHIFILGIASSICISGFLLLLKGKIFNIISSLTLGLLLAAYTQSILLNPKTGEFTGDRISWELMWKKSLLNTIIWVIIVVLPAIICAFHKKIWKGILIFMPVMLIGMQLTALVIPFATTDVLTDKKSTSALTTKGYFDVSSKENIIMLVLDRLDYNYVTDIIASSGEEFFEPLDGFTFFNNTVPLYARTFPSVTYYLTGEKFDYSMPKSEYFKKAWNNTKFLPELKKNNYELNLYIEKSASYSDINQIKDLADNVIDAKLTAKTAYLIKKLFFPVMYRYSPDIMKPSFWQSTLNFSDCVSVESQYSLLKVDDINFYKKLKEDRLNVRDDKNIFVYHHLQGSHTPFKMNANAEAVPENETNVTEQTKGCFKIVFEYLDQLKELGLYENSTILIFGDHGKTFNGTKLESPHAIGMFVKPRGSSGTPMKTSNAPVSHTNIQATVLKSAGFDYEAYGKSMFDISENSDTVREFYSTTYYDVHSYLFELYSVKGDAHNFSNWTKLSEMQGTPLTDD